MENLRKGPMSERLKRIDGFWSEGRYYLPEDFMTPEQGDAYLAQFQQTVDGINTQLRVFMGSV